MRPMRLVDNRDDLPVAAEPHGSFDRVLQERAGAYERAVLLGFVIPKPALYERADADAATAGQHNGPYSGRGGHGAFPSGPNSSEKRPCSDVRRPEETAR